MKKLSILMILSMILFLLSINGYCKESVYQKNSSISFSGGKRTVNAIYIDLNDKTIRMESVLAKDQIGKVDDLKNIAESANSSQSKVLGAINGSFFNSYSDFQPSSTIQTQGEFVHLAQTGSIIGFKGDNSVIVENLYTSILGSINGSYEYPNNWSAWGFNHKY